MDLEILARQLGKAIQEDERFLAMMQANSANEADADLGTMLDELRLIQMNFNREMGRENPDNEKIEGLNGAFSALYQQVTANENMLKFQRAKEELDTLMKRITGILSLCALGEDPDTCEPSDNAGCGGSCSECSGCSGD